MHRQLNNEFVFLEFSSRGHSPCRSPDSTEGRTTPKFYISKLCIANTNSSSSQSSSSAAPSPNSSAMELPMDIIPNLCAKAISNSNCANSDVNSDLDCSDVDFDSDSQQKTTKQIKMHKRDAEACEKLKKLYFARVSTDSAETDCSIDFKTQLNNELLNTNLLNDSNLLDNKSESSMDCDSTKKSMNNFSHVQNVVSSTDDIKETLNLCKNDSPDDTKMADFIAKCVSTNDCVTVSDVVDANIAIVEAVVTNNSV